MTDLELTTATGSEMLIYLCLMMVVMGVALVALHVYILPAIGEAVYKVRVGLYKGLRRNHEATGGSGYIRKG